jgi:hypothetical protein
LIGHRSWLEREDFVGEFAETFESTTGHSPMTVLDWSAALGAVESGRVLCSSSESQMLRIAASIAEGIPVDLRGTLCGLDSTNSVLVAQALLHAAGHQRCGFAISEQR